MNRPVLSLHFDFSDCPLPAESALAAAEGILHAATASPLSIDVEVTTRGMSQYHAEQLVARGWPVKCVLQ